MKSHNALEAAQVKISQLYVHTTAHGYALAHMKRAIKTYVRTQKSMGFVLTGDSRSGKTRLIREFSNWLDLKFSQLDENRKPLLYVELPENTSPKGLASALLDAGGDRFAWNDSTKVSKDDRSKALMNEKRVMTIAFDEFHHLSEGKTPNAVKISTQAIKRYFNRLGVFVILSGLDKIIDFVLSSDELRLRFRYGAKLPTYGVTNKDELVAFRGFLREVEKCLPLHPNCSPDGHASLLRMIIASGGVVGSAVDLYDAACAIAIERHDRVVRNEHLAEVYSTTLDNLSGHYNPFDLPEKDIIRESAKLLQMSGRSKGKDIKNPWNYDDQQ